MALKSGMKYYAVQISSTLLGNTLYELDAPVKGSNAGRCNANIISKKFSGIVNVYNGINFSASEYKTLKVPEDPKSNKSRWLVKDSNFVHESNCWTISAAYSLNYICSAMGKSYSIWEQEYITVANFIKNKFDTQNINYIKIKNGDLYQMKHTKNNCNIRRLMFYNGKLEYDEYLDLSAPLKYAHASDHHVPSKHKESKWSIIYEISYKFSEVNITKDTNWRLGQIGLGNAAIGTNNYCFYCNNYPRALGKTHTETLNWYFSCSNISRLPINNEGHDCSIHGISSSDYAGDIATSNQTTSRQLTYRNKWINSATPDMSSLSPNKKLKFGTKGEYTDGVAPIPYVMIELRGSIDADTSSKTNCYNLSIPANSFVSLTHERNLDDSYNTFSLQLFDKDAMEVEAKLVLGFRYIRFWYTDFISTSKEFKGEVLDYKTVITGKGLMLTLSGYTTNVERYLTKDSIPWSIFGRTGVYKFYYWTNKAGEYHGEVYCDGTHYNSSGDGLIVSPLADSYDKIKDVSYSLKAETDEETGKVDWVTFDEYYSGSPTEDKDLYRPYVEEWSLEQYNKNLDSVLASDSTIGYYTWYEKRPSDIVKLICAINGWLWHPGDIVKTRKVTEIPDQVSMSYTEYIIKKLLPISISEGSVGSTQYYFWFDDDGYAHFGPKDTVSSGVSLYFNSVDKKDSYPLIAFTAATNGSILMANDKTHSISAVNVYTGDDLQISSVLGVTDDKTYNQTIQVTSEWYSTNIKTLERNKDDNLISYSNTSAVPSEEELKNMLITRYGTISRFTFKASLDVYCCADLTPGQVVDIYIYLDDKARSSEPISELAGTETEYIRDSSGNIVSVFTGKTKTDSNGNITLEYKDLTKETNTYKGNITAHHTSGTYFINKITDTISAGKYISSLEVLKIDKAAYLESITYNTAYDTTSSGITEGSAGYAFAHDVDESNSVVNSSGELINQNNGSTPFDNYNSYKNLLN